jgi:NADH-quinone oxidoreductase subunit F
MDLHFTDAAPTEAERDAVDAFLVSLVPERPAREHLIPALHAIQSRVGWISPGGLNLVCRELGVPPAEAFGVADFYALFSTKQQAPAVVHVCDDIGCRDFGAEALCASVKTLLGPEGSGTGASWHRSPCLGLCERAPAALAIVSGERPVAQALAPASLDAVEIALEGATVEQPDVAQSVPQAGAPELVLLARIGTVDPENIDAYVATKGFDALRRAFEIGPEEVVREVTVARLVGRGGAAFPTGVKWSGARKAPSPRYLICNADESEPGTFKDRVVMEGDPFSLIESMAIAGFAVGCARGYLYIRGEYPLATQRLEIAITQARVAGYLGTDILGSGFDFDVELRRGAGAYICGEETALMNSIEGRRGEPRNKPPFPTQVGLYGRPTVINNVETLVNLPHIVLGGGEAFANVGTERSTGTKLFCVAGHVGHPGVYELPFGATLREVIERAGGVGGTGRLQTVLLGGAAGSFVGPEDLDVELTFEGTRAIGAALGSAVVMPFDDSVDLGQILLRIASFFRDESCGQCVPCRVGTVRQEELLHRLSSGRPQGSRRQDLELLKDVGQVMRDASICGLGHTASSAIESALARFPVFEEKQ